jgi:sucrose phosphorylase
VLRNQCQLITYPDSFGRNLSELRKILAEHFAGCFGGLHILPFYPSSGDRGFAPITYDEVDAGFGSWEDIDLLAKDYDLMVDFIVNHISRQSVYFQDYLQQGEQSPYADLFIRLSQMTPDGNVSEADLAKVYTRKPRLPYLEETLSDGTKERVWCTFAEEQIDLNVGSELGSRYIAEWLKGIAVRGVKIIRVDAFGYVIKKLGTSCFFVEPETSDFLAKLQRIVKPYGVELLPEIHEHHSIQLRLADQGYYVYDFALPMLVLQALYEGTNVNLINWLKICPRRQITTLDTHDGLPVVDVVDLMTAGEIDRTQENLYKLGANVLRRYSVDPEYDNVDVYQINCTYYSALCDNDDAYLVARAIQFFAPGIPQVYYVGLLAGSNDVDLMEQTKFGRNINRHNYSAEEIVRELNRPVVQRLKALMTFRNNYPAFNGEMVVLDSPKDYLTIKWSKGKSEATLQADLLGHKAVIRYYDEQSGKSREIQI